MPRFDSKLADENLPRLEAAVEAFAQAWHESGIPPSITEFLDRCEETQRSRLVVELVKIDIEQRWQCGLRKLIEDYATEIPVLSNSITPQLILEEFRARKLAGDDVNRAEYFDRFPGLAPSLEKLIVVDPILQSTVATVDETVVADMPNAGESIDDFDLLLVLGKGAFATVFLARQRSMQRIVAVKVSTQQCDEPQTLAQLDHNNIIRVFDQRAVDGRGLRLLYMQYASGGTLGSAIEYLESIPAQSWTGKHYLQAIDRVLERRGESASTESSTREKIAAMSWPQVVCWVGSQLSRALDYAHRRGVLHRDLKPANVLLTSDGVPKLADFNISFSNQVENATPERYFGGSLAYMSPEQLEVFCKSEGRTAESLDHASDQFSLGVVIWELLLGKRPFSHQVDRAGIPLFNEMIAQRHRGPDPILGNSPEYVALNQVLHRCLAAKPENRYRNCLELAHDMELCLQPHARELVNPAPGGWKPWVRRFPLFVVVMLTLVPNLVGAIFNFLYNHAEIIERLPNAEPTFMRIQTIINSVAFPVGIVSSFWLAGSVTRATQVVSAKKLTAEALVLQRRRCLNLGNIAAAVGLILWLIAAPVYPVSLHLMLGSVPPEVYMHFVLSLTLCGLIAAAYPFFGVTFVAVRCFYPSLIDRETMTSNDRFRLEGLMRQTWFYLILAASVPMIAIMILALAEPESHLALVVLASAGILGYGIAISAFRLIQIDVGTLVQAIWRD